MAVGLEERFLRALATTPLQSWLQSSFEHQVGRARGVLAGGSELAGGVGRTLVRTVQGAVTLAALVPLLARADPLIPVILLAAQAATLGVGVRTNRVAALAACPEAMAWTHSLTERSSALAAAKTWAFTSAGMRTVRLGCSAS